MPNITRAVKRKFIAKHGSICFWCESTENLTIDHIYAMCLGGTKGKSNWQVLCDRCNCRKAMIEQQIALERDPERETRNHYNVQPRLDRLSLWELDEIYCRILRSSVTCSKSHKQKYQHRRDKSRLRVLQELNKRMFMEY